MVPTVTVTRVNQVSEVITVYTLRNQHCTSTVYIVVELQENTLEPGT